MASADTEPDSTVSTKPTDLPAGLPVYGWRRDLDKAFEEKWGPLRSKHIRIRQLAEMIGQGFRYIQLYYKLKREGRRIFIDQFEPTKLKQIYGVPIGGIGCGAINRGWKGDFCRWCLTPGMYSYDIVESDQFTVCIRSNGKTVYQQVLSPGKPEGRVLEHWKWNFPGGDATYLGLYPRAWTIYRIPEFQVTLVCRQISPVFPNDYKDTTIPAGVFVWEVHNYSDQPLDVSIMFTFQNGTGQPSDKLGGRWNEPFLTRKTSEVHTTVSGVLLHDSHTTMGCTMAVSAAVTEGVSVSHVSGFNPYDKSDRGKSLWEDLHEDGQLECPPGPTEKTKKGSVISAAVAAKRTVASGDKGQLEFVLTWDMPNVHFKSQRRKYKRRYARWFGNHGNAAPALSTYAINNYANWEEKIEAWQNPILENPDLPDWYKSALFNELYYISDGGTIWVDLADDPGTSNGEVNNETLKPGHAKLIKEYGRFAYLEGHEYRMYNTYDVHFYASFALAMLWPKLELCIQHDFGMFVEHADEEVFKELNTGRPTPRKLVGSVPHDIGDPEEEPWLSINSYYLHDTSQWKDLNLKFVLLTYRDYYITQDMDFLREMWPRLKLVMETSKKHDTDGDGLIDNSGFPDQTYDAWTVTGASAYCGGLWLAALSIMCEVSRVLGYHREYDEYKSLLERGKESYETKLWNGKYYNYDCSGKYYSNSIMADQAAGHWILRACNFVSPNNPVFPVDHIKSALQTIFELNVMGINNGTFGAMNGVRPNGKIDPSSLQAEEVWTGVTYALAASMIQEGMVKEGFQTASGVYETCFNRLGFAYQTPEAYMAKKAYRSLGYMRPLSIWSMQWAVENWHESIPNKTS
ncbi:non-lysosomal glucosylceramidase-like [Anneissia japonica]|uniref:non-lysosomal glucosylceramidase-like n=1 Tax=Anneissia japonica TaxID=1529436 RepID=UPI0014256994|nr:non-lysosomal glucosylceramidase-like [Anneissia japonica]